ncbi:TPA: DHHA1 domain-containing protein [Vibrio parahaemolyticus]
MKDIICIYHANCCDGMGAAWVVNAALSDEANIQFVPATYQEEPPEVKGKELILVDFSYKRPVMEKLAQEAVRVTVIDHHKSAELELGPLLESGVIDGNFDMNKSGAMLAWDWFIGNEVTPPELIQHIQDRDLWKFELKGTREIQAALYSYPMEFDVWDKLMSQPVKKLYDEGVSIDRAHKKNVKGLVEFCAYRQTIAGYDVPVLNCNYMFASDAGHDLAINELFSATYYDTEEFRKYSLRSSHDNGIDVSKVAEQFGGGGHKNAAGFKIALADLHKLAEGEPC